MQHSPSMQGTSVHAIYYAEIVRRYAIDGGTHLHFFLFAARAKMAEIFEGAPTFIDLNVVEEMTP